MNGPDYSHENTNAYYWPGKNGWWFTGGWDMTNLAPAAAATLVNAANFDFNEVEISAICAPWGSSFTLYTNASSPPSGWSQDIAAGVFSTLTSGAVHGTNWIVPLSCGDVISQYGARNIMLYQTAPGTNRIVNIWCLNRAVTNGVAFNLLYEPSSSMAEMLAVSNAIRAPIYAGWNPDLILFDSIEGEGTILTNCPLWLGFYKANCSNADICLTGIYPTYQDGNGSDEDPIKQNLAYESNAVTMAVSYFDGHSALESTNNEILRGFWEGPQNDGVHMDGYYQGWDGLSAWAYMWYRWMDIPNL
ncbi:MAG: hypothetical protein ACRED1_07190 [Limisphaerales bacterium]